MNRILPGAEPFLFPGGETGVLLAHGFTASPQEMHGLGQHLAREGFTVLGVRLFAHGTRVEDMLRARWHDWLGSVEDGYRLLQGSCSRVVLVGFSTGGALSLLFSTHHEVSALAVLSTPFRLPPDPRLKTLRPILRPLSLILRALPKSHSVWFDPEAQSARVAYEAYPLRAIIELESLLNEMRQALPSVQVPVLLMHSKNDRFIPPDHMSLIYEAIGSNDKTMHWVENSSHIITCDADRHIVFETVTNYLHRVIRDDA